MVVVVVVVVVVLLLLLLLMLTPLLVLMGVSDHYIQRQLSMLSASAPNLHSVPRIRYS